MNFKAQKKVVIVKILIYTKIYLIKNAQKNN
jgi:hypothetical protein